MSRVRRRRGSPPSRGAHQRIVRIHSEGEVTEPKYLGHWARRRGSSLKISWGMTGADPLSLVQAARDDMREMKLKRKPADRPFDEVWCVFDRDAHNSVPQALNEARQGGIQVAFSDPCFELWLVLHAQPRSAPIDRHEANRLARNLGLVDRKNKKDVPASAWKVLEPGYGGAKVRAKALAKGHVAGGSPPRSNPSSDVWRLVDVLRSPVL